MAGAKGRTIRRPKLALFVVALTPYGLLLANDGKAPAKKTFGKDVAPIFRAHCVSCHSGKAPAAKLDLSSGKGMAKAAKLLDIKNPKASVLMQRLRGQGGMPQMPMGFAPLSAAELSRIEEWIADGASFDDAGAGKHWSYVTPVRPKPPTLASTWIRNPIDAFVLARLKREGLRPSPEASKEVLLRRVSLDITGLPPTPQEIDRFLADKSPDAYEKAVDRLLASPHYGEKQAQAWLDLARYADSNGYEKDLKRSAWKYRDWVIDAFNQNMPYDRFTIEQIAGDLLPNATLQDRVATGFHRNTMFNQEGGVDQEEAHFAVVLDRVDTTATVWLGSTLACARCHDHKYDPFSQRDYYRMAAFFSNSKVYPQGPKEIGEEKWFEAEIPVPSPQQEAEMKALDKALAEDQARLKKTDTDFADAFAQWKKDTLTAPTWQTLTPVSASADDAGVKLTPQSDGSVLAGGANPARVTYTLKFPTAPTNITGFRIEVLPDASLGNQGPGRAGNGNFVLTSVSMPPYGRRFISAARADLVQVKYGVDRLDMDDGVYGWAISGGQGKPHQLAFSLAKPLLAGSPVELRLASTSNYPQHTLGRFRISFTSAPEPLADFLPDGLRKSIQSGMDDSKVEDYFRQVSSLFAETRQQVAELRQKRQQLSASFPTALVMEDKPTQGPLTAFLRHRGEFLSKEEEVTASTPEVLPALKNPKANRLDLARWLVRKDNPLTARVQINRMWESVFGRGIVETSEDFGTRGAEPTHRELLDWLACEFMAKNWDMKAMLRTIVTSSTYRQSSGATAVLLERDPSNLLLARGPRFRLPAETIRDNALAASGLLSPKVGGPSVYPAQPSGVWDSPYSGEQWNYSKGEDRFRRGLYTFWKRTSTYPAFMAFDATSREACTVRRIRTNTPLQALELLNDDAMLEAAKALGTRMRKGSPSDTARIVTGFRLCTGRKPDAKETARLTALLTQLQARYRKAPQDAKTLGGTVDDAAWTMVGSVLLNLDETITKG